MAKASVKSARAKIKDHQESAPGETSLIRTPSEQAFGDPSEEDDFGHQEAGASFALAEVSDFGQVEGLSPVAMRLLQAATDMKQSPDSYERAFLARQLIQCTFPHSDPGNVPIWSRTNGNLTLSIRPLYDEEKAAHKYPYGTIPQLFLYWMVTEAA